MAGTKKDFTDHGYCQYSVGALHVVQLFNVPAIGAGVASTVVQARFVTPARVKIAAIGLYASALNTIDGSIGFNIVVGSGAYDTGATNATGTYTITGVPANPCALAKASFASSPRVSQALGLASAVPA